MMQKLCYIYDLKCMFYCFHCFTPFTSLLYSFSLTINTQFLSFEEACPEKETVEDHTKFSEIFISKSDKG